MISHLSYVVAVNVCENDILRCVRGLFSCLCEVFVETVSEELVQLRLVVVDIGIRVTVSEGIYIQIG